MVDMISGELSSFFSSSLVFILQLPSLYGPLVFVNDFFFPLNSFFCVTVPDLLPYATTSCRTVMNTLILRYTLGMVYLDFERFLSGPYNIYYPCLCFFSYFIIDNSSKLFILWHSFKMKSTP